MARESRIPNGPKEAFLPIEPSDPSYPKALADYCCQQFLVQDRQVMQVYEEFVNLAHWIRGFAPHNVMEIGTAGATFFLLFAARDRQEGRDRHTRHTTKDSQFHVRPRVVLLPGRFPHHPDAERCQLLLRHVRPDLHRRRSSIRRGEERLRELPPAPLRSRVIMFHAMDPDHVFRGAAGGDAWRFWAELDEGSKQSCVVVARAAALSFLVKPVTSEALASGARDDRCNSRHSPWVRFTPILPQPLPTTRCRKYAIACSPADLDPSGDLSNACLASRC